MRSNSNNSHENYPTSNVITVYLFFGGAIGGGVIGLVIAVFMVLEAVLQSGGSQSIVGSLALALLAIPTFAFFGSLIGLIPATLTGCLVASLKLYRDLKGLSQSTIIGTISTIICALLLTFVSNFTFSFAVFIFAIVIGSISGYLTGLCFLPKSCKSRFDNGGKIEHDNSQELSSFK